MTHENLDRKQNSCDMFLKNIYLAVSGLSCGMQA